MRELRSPRRLEIRQQVKLCSVVCTMVPATERNHAEPVAAPAQGTRDQMRGIDAPIRPAYDAPAFGYRGTLLLGCRH